MQKKIIISFIALIIVTGCSVKRKALTTTRESDFSASATLMVSDVKELNFTAQPFFIQRADINIVDKNNNSQRVLASIRFAQPDSFLISVRALGGIIEVARILLTSDTILVNDRINSTLYFGSNQNLSRRYGFDLMFFPVLLGDLITGQQTLPEISCLAGTTIFREFRRNYIVNYLIDCATKKCKEARVENELMRDYFAIKFDDFAEDGKLIFPRHVKINNFADFALLEMKIDRVEFGTGSGIEFIPGRNFERVEIR